MQWGKCRNALPKPFCHSSLFVFFSLTVFMHVYFWFTSGSSGLFPISSVLHFISESWQNFPGKAQFDSSAFGPARRFTYSVVPSLLTFCTLFCSSFRCVCNIDCSQTNFNPLCASDGKSYDNACQIKEASCQKQEKIEVMSLGRCQGNVHSKISFQKMFFSLCAEMKSEANSLLGTYFISERQFWFTMDAVVSCRICVDYGCLRAHQQQCMSFSE